MWTILRILLWTHYTRKSYCKSPVATRRCSVTRLLLAVADQEKAVQSSATVKSLQCITMIHSIQKCGQSLQAGEAKRFKNTMISRPHTSTNTLGLKPQFTKKKAADHSGWHTSQPCCPGQLWIWPLPAPDKVFISGNNLILLVLPISVIQPMIQESL